MSEKISLDSSELNYKYLPSLSLQNTRLAKEI
jgi:hypothetical protein